MRLVVCLNARFYYCRLKNLLSNRFNSNLVDITAELFLKEESLLELNCELQVGVSIKNAFFKRRNITIILEAHFTTDLTLSCQPT